MVRAFHNKYGAMIGGYVLNHNGPFRVIESLPPEVKENSPWTKKEILDSTYEVTGLWLDQKVTTRRQNFAFWATMYRDMVFTKKKYFVYAYDLDKTYLKKLYSIVNPTVIYEGETLVQEGMKGSCEESVEIGSVNYIRFGLVYGWDYFLKKLVLPRKVSNRYGIAMFAKYGQAFNVFSLKSPAINKNHIK
jgi:hypothetical protein